MSKFGPFKSAFLEVNGVDLSDHVDSVALNTTMGSNDEHAMGDNTALQRPSLLDWSIDVSFIQDFAAGNVDATIWPLYSGGQTFAVRFRPDQGAKGTTNPEWSGDAFVSSYTPASGGHGDELMAPATFRPRSDLIRTTT